MTCIVILELVLLERRIHSLFYVNLQEGVCVKKTCRLVSPTLIASLLKEYRYSHWLWCIPLNVLLLLLQSAIGASDSEHQYCGDELSRGQDDVILFLVWHTKNNVALDVMHIIIIVLLNFVKLLHWILLMICMVHWLILIDMYTSTWLCLQSHDKIIKDYRLIHFIISKQEIRPLLVKKFQIAFTSNLDVSVQ